MIFTSATITFLPAKLSSHSRSSFVACGEMGYIRCFVRTHRMARNFQNFVGISNYRFGEIARTLNRTSILDTYTLADAWAQLGYNEPQPPRLTFYTSTGTG